MMQDHSNSHQWISKTCLHNHLIIILAEQVSHTKYVAICTLDNGNRSALAITSNVECLRRTAMSIGTPTQIPIIGTDPLSHSGSLCAIQQCAFCAIDSVKFARCQFTLNTRIAIKTGALVASNAFACSITDCWVIIILVKANI